MREFHKLRALNAKLLPQKMLVGPKWIILGVNNVCNLHCKMCDVGTNNLESNFAINLVGTKPINMPLDLFKNIIDQTAKNYPSAKIGYAFTEPLVYPHLGESLEYANSKNLYTSITTNALSLRQKAETLVKGGLNELFISLDGLEDVHNEIRGNKKSFQKAIEGIEEILKYDNPPKISLFCCITEWNIGTLVSFLDYFKKYPIHHIGFMHLNFTPQSIADKHNLVYKQNYPITDSNVDEIDVDKMDLDLLWKEISEIKQKNYPFGVSFSPEISSKEKLDDFYLKPEKLIGNKCMDAFSNIMIKSDGSSIPAHGRCYKINTGNIYKQTLPEMWNSQNFKDFRKTLMKAGGLLPGCSRCCSAF